MRCSDDVVFIDAAGDVRGLGGELANMLAQHEARLRLVVDPEREQLRADLRAHGFDVERFEADELAAGRPEDVIEAIEREALRQLQQPKPEPRTGSKYAKARAKYAKQRREKARKKRKAGRR